MGQLCSGCTKSVSLPGAQPQGTHPALLQPTSPGPASEPVSSLSLIYKPMWHISCAQSWAYRGVRSCPHPHSAEDQAYSISVPPLCLWDVLSGMKE